MINLFKVSPDRPCDTLLKIKPYSTLVPYSLCFNIEINEKNTACYLFIVAHVRVMFHTEDPYIFLKTSGGNYLPFC